MTWWYDDLMIWWWHSNCTWWFDVFLQAFEKNQYVVGQERKELAKNLNLSETQVRKKKLSETPVNFLAQVFGFQFFLPSFLLFFQIGFWPRTSIIPRLKSCHYDHDLSMIIMMVAWWSWWSSCCVALCGWHARRGGRLALAGVRWRCQVITWRWGVRHWNVM